MAVVEGEVIQEGQGATLTPGSAGLQTQLPGQAATASGIAEATGGVGAGNLMERDIDAELFEFESDDTPLMSLMLKAKRVPVKSPEVEHYMVDEEKSSVTLTADVSENTSSNTAVLTLDAQEQKIPRPYGTLRVRGVAGYSEDGQTETPGEDLQLFVTGYDPTTGNPIVRAVNGPKQNASDVYCTILAIPAGTVLDVLGNALYETQAAVDPDAVAPTPQVVYLQKRGMNQIVSDYYESQKKRIPFGKAILAEHAIRIFKRRSNRTLWAGRKGKIVVDVEKTGPQTVYFTEGVRWQFKRELEHSGKWTYEEFIGLAKMVYTGADVPNGADVLAGKNFLENIQCIDFTKHREVKIDVTTNRLGWSVTRIHTVFGDLEFKHEPTLDKLGWSNSCGVFGSNRLVHYERTTEHEVNERIEGEEATRKGVIVWDALALKGSCHIWVNGEGEDAQGDSVAYKFWDDEAAPSGDDLETGAVYYLTADCPGIDKQAKTGTLWTYDGTSWSKFTGE